MKANIIAAAILGACLIVAAFVHSGRYYALVAQNGAVVKVDRWTGKTETIRTDKQPFEF